MSAMTRTSWPRTRLEVDGDSVVDAVSGSAVTSSHSDRCPDDGNCCHSRCRNPPDDRMIPFPADDINPVQQTHK